MCTKKTFYYSAQNSLYAHLTFSAMKRFTSFKGLVYFDI